VTRLKWNIDSVLLEIVLTLTQDRYMVCVERTRDSEIDMYAPDGTTR
jgi:hypothetical protein